MNELLQEAQDVYQREQDFLATGKDLDEFDIDSSMLLKPLPKQAGDGLEMNGSKDPKLHSVVLKTKGVKSVQKAMHNYREKYGDGNQSKACVIL